MVLITISSSCSTLESTKGSVNSDALEHSTAYREIREWGIYALCTIVNWG